MINWTDSFKEHDGSSSAESKVASAPSASRAANACPEEPPSSLQTGPDAIIRKHMPELDSLRGVAILMVIFLHGLYWSPHLGALHGPVGLLNRISRFGGRGVNLFFVLSGFLITGILIDSRTKKHFYRRFYARRARRILPVFYVTLVVLLCTPGQSRTYLALSCFFLANCAYLFAIPMTYPMLWTLAVEEHFYLLWPFATKRLSDYALSWLAIAIAISVAVVRAIFYKPILPDGFGYYTWFAADGLSMGAFLALLVRQAGFTRTCLKRTAFGSLALWAAATVAGAPFGILFQNNRLGAALSLTLTNLFFFALLAMAVWIGSGRYQRWVRWRILEFFGYISYGLYLTHWLVFDGFDATVNAFRPGPYPATGQPGLILIRFVSAGAIATLVAFLSRRYIEDPILRYRLSPHSESDSSPEDGGPR
jgi:peptidoglycan/LPS O-acetylase OafA/YrhL